MIDVIKETIKATCMGLIAEAGLDEKEQEELINQLKFAIKKKIEELEKVEYSFKWKIKGFTKYHNGTAQGVDLADLLSSLGLNSEAEA